MMRPLPPKAARRRGYTLLEMLACIAVLTLLLPSASKFYVSITRLHYAESAALDRVLSFNELEHDFRETAARALAVAPAAGAYKSEGNTVVLQMPAGFCVFTTDSKRHAQRITLTQQAGGWEQRIISYRIPRYTCRFAASPGAPSIEFFADPVQATDRQGNPIAKVHLLAALRSFDAAASKQNNGGTP